MPADDGTECQGQPRDRGPRAQRARAKPSYRGRCGESSTACSAQTAAPDAHDDAPDDQLRGETETAQTMEPAQKITTPINMIRLRPKLSPSDPQINIRLAKASA